MKVQTSIRSDETAGLDFQDFGKGIMAADAAATQKAALANAIGSTNVILPLSTLLQETLVCHSR